MTHARRPPLFPLPVPLARPLALPLATSLLTVAACIAGHAPAASATPPTRPPSLFGDELEGCWLVIDAATGELRDTIDDGLCDVALPPASTFKIFNTLVAVDEGVIEGPDDAFAWDGVERRVASWNRDQTVGTAFRNSALWAYQQIAAQVGLDAYRRHLARERYGNARTGDDVRTFWLERPLAITPRDQARFIARLARGEVGFSERARAVVEEIGTSERADGSLHFTKTGWSRPPGLDVLWQVGWVEREGRRDVYVLAFRMGRDAQPGWRLRQRVLARAFEISDLD